MAMSSVAIRSGANSINDHFSKIYSASGVWDAGSIADGDEAVDTIALTGVALGDIVLGVSCSIDVADAALTAAVTAAALSAPAAQPAAVTAANEVTVQLLNNTGSAVDLDSATYRVVVGRLA